MKKFCSLLLVVCLSLFIPVQSYAMENNNEYDYMNYDFPEDAIVLYQGQDGVVYQSKIEDKLDNNRSMQYNYAWIPAGQHPTGTFGMTNPHQNGTTEGTFKIESDYSNAKAQMTMYGGAGFHIVTKYVKASDGDVRFSFNSSASGLTIRYFVQNYSNSYGMRLMCWLW